MCSLPLSADVREGEVGPAEAAVGPLLREELRDERGQVGGGSTGGRQRGEGFDEAAGEIAAEVPEAAAGVEGHVGEDEVLGVGGDARLGEAPGREVDTPGEVPCRPRPGSRPGARGRGRRGGGPPRGGEAGRSEREVAEEPAARCVGLHRRPSAGPPRTRGTGPVLPHRTRGGGGSSRLHASGQGGVVGRGEGIAPPAASTPASPASVVPIARYLRPAEQYRLPLVPSARPSKGEPA
jgi:hypothetical protein